MDSIFVNSANDEIRRGGSDSRELARAVTRRLDCLVRRFLCLLSALIARILDF